MPKRNVSNRRMRSGMVRNGTYALLWAAGGALMVVGAVLTLNSNVIFALLFTGMAAAFFLVAASCLLMEPKVRADANAGASVDADDGDDGYDPGPDENQVGRRRWGPR